MNNNLGNKKINSKINNSYFNKTRRFISDQSDNFSAVNIIYMIVFICILGLIIYYGYNLYYSSDKKIVFEEIIPNIIDTKIQYSIAGSSIPSSQYSNEYSISFWLKINEFHYRYGEEKIILRRGLNDNINPEIILGAKDNSITTRIGLQTQIKEHFNNIINSKPSCLDFQFVSDNNPKLNVAVEGIFGSVSGNDVKPLNMMIPWIDMTNAEYKGNTVSCICGLNNNKKEKFMNNDNLDMFIEVIYSMIELFCDLIKNISDTITAEYILSLINITFSFAIEHIDTVSNETVSFENLDLNNILDSVDLSNINNFSSKFQDDINRFMNKFIEIQNKMASIDFNATEDEKVYIINKVNEKIKEINCDLYINYDDLKEDASTNLKSKNLKVSLVKLIQKNVYQLIYNLGVEVAKKYGDQIVTEEGRLSDKIGTCKINQFPLQKWTHFVITQYNQNINLYQDGQLVSSCILKGFPLVSTDDIILFPDGGLDGQLSRMTYINMALNQYEINSIYNDGPVKSEPFYETIPTWIIILITVIITIIIVLLIIS